LLAGAFKRSTRFSGPIIRTCGRHSFVSIKSGIWAAFLDRDQNTETGTAVRKIGVGDALQMEG
jgi:hypothetical protein